MTALVVATATPIAVILILRSGIRPEFAAGVYSFLIFTESSEVVTELTGVPLLAEAMVGVTLLAVVGDRRRNGEYPSAVLWLLMVILPFVLFSLLSYFWAEQPDLVVARVVVYGRLTLMAVVLSLSVRSTDGLRTVVWGLIAGAMFLSSVGIIQFLTNSFEFDFFGFGVSRFEGLGTGEEASRIAGPIGDPNFFAQRLVVVLPMALERGINGRGLQRILGLSAFVLALSAILLTYSRGGAMAAAVLIVATLFHFMPLRRALLAIGAGITLLWAVLPATYVERTAALAQVTSIESATETSLSGRTSETVAALEMFVDHPLFGIGTEQYPVFYQEYAVELGLDDRVGRAPHSLFGQLAAENGVIGMALFGLVIAAACFTVGRARRALRVKGLWIDSDLLWAIRLGLFGYLIAAAFLHFAFARVLFVVLALCLASYAAVVDRDRQTPSVGGIPMLAGSWR